MQPIKGNLLAIRRRDKTSIAAIFPVPHQHLTVQIVAPETVWNRRTGDNK